MRFLGVDLHKKYISVSVRDEAGKEGKVLRAESDIRGFVAGLGSQDAVILEASAGAMYWAEEIQRNGATCTVIDPYRFRIIRDSWQKTDRRDAANLSLALWMSWRSGEVKLPEVWQPQPVVRELRRLFGVYDLLNKEICRLKNAVQGILLDNGVRDRSTGIRLVRFPTRAEELLKDVQLSAASRFAIRSVLGLLEGLHGHKEELKQQICRTGKPLAEDVKLLIGIRGVTPLLALAFLAEVGDITRFSSARKMHSYLGVVPTVRSSGGVTRSGGINRRSRALSRTLFTQALPHLVDSSPTLSRFYRDLAKRKGFGRARVAVLRKTFSMMRRMLLSRQPYRWIESRLYEQKIKGFMKQLNGGKSQEAA